MRTQTGLSKIVRLAVFALAAGLMASVISASPVTGQPARAPVTPTPTPTPTPEPIPVRKVGWLNSAAARAPQGLQRTVALTGMGGGPPDICAGILLAPEAEAWFIPRSTIVVNDPHDPAYLEAMYCGANPDPNVQFFLTDPSGNTWALPVTGDRTYAEYEFPPTSPEGMYRLTIATRTGRYETAISVYQNNRPRLYLWDVATQTPRRDFSPGQSMFADYYGFTPGTRLEVGFYRTAPGGLKQTLVDLWQVTIGQNGRFVETLPIPANAPAGEYALIACDLAACETHLDRASSQLATNVFWEEFTVSYPAHVSSTVSGSGLPLWSTLSADAQALRMLFAGEEVRVLEGPIKQQNRLWYRVEHPASSLQGWVLGEHLTVSGQ
jgi:hypothetical protein